MAELINFEVKQLPKLYLIGKEKRMNMEATMGSDNPIPGFWQECKENGVISKLEEQNKLWFEDSTIGMMLDWERGDGDFTYVIGTFFTEDAPVPEDFCKIPFEPCKVAIGYIKGQDGPDVYSAAHQMTEEKLKKEGYSDDGMTWCAEVYNCPRFTKPDSEGNVILDYYLPLKD